MLRRDTRKRGVGISAPADEHPRAHHRVAVVDRFRLQAFVQPGVRPCRRQAARTSMSLRSMTASPSRCWSSWNRSVSSREARRGRRFSTARLISTGRLPCNTHGGLLSYAHSGAAGGMFHIVEAVRQLRREAVGRQVIDPELAFVQWGWRDPLGALLAACWDGRDDYPNKRCRVLQHQLPSLSSGVRIMKPLPQPNTVTQRFWSSCSGGPLRIPGLPASCGNRQFPPRLTCTSCPHADLGLDGVERSRCGLFLLYRLSGPARRVQAPMSPTSSRSSSWRRGYGR